MPEDGGLPREVPIDPQVPAELQERYVSVDFAASLAGVTPRTIQRHLQIGTLAGLRVGGKAWLVRRHTDGEVPAIDLWEPGKPGNPAWKTKQND